MVNIASMNLRIAAAVALWLVLAALLVGAVGDTASDDMFITYRYARNLAQGEGFVYNSGERVFGLTNPGVGLVLAAAHAVTGVDVPRIANVLTGLILVAFATLLLVEARTRDRKPEAFVGGTLLFLCAFVWACRGSGPPWVLLLLVCAAGSHDRRPWQAGVLAGLAVWFRPDAGLGVGLLGLLLWVEHRRLPWRFGLAAATTMLAGVTLAWAYFGQPIPHTLEAKRVVGDFGGHRASWESFWNRGYLTVRTYAGSGTQLLVALGIAGQVPWFARAGRMGRFVALYAVAVAVAYPFLGVGFFVWYALPVAVALLYGIAYLAGEVGRTLSAKLLGGPQGHSSLRPGLAALLAVAVLAFPTWSMVWRNIDIHHDHRPEPRLVQYRQAAEWIRLHTHRATTVALTEIGVFGYYSQRPIHDMIGLVTPETTRHLQLGSMKDAFLADPAGAVVVPDRGWIKGLSNQPWFQEAYEEAARFDEPRSTETVRIYLRRPGSRLPS